MKKIQDAAATIFIICVAILTVVSVMGVWELFEGDVITKSFQTVGILAGAAVITIFAGRFMDNHHIEPTSTQSTEAVLSEPTVNSTFSAIRYVTVVSLITSASLLALIGILSIWEVLKGDILAKSASSIGIVAFSSFLIIAVCLEREDHPIIHKKISGWVILLAIVLVWSMVSSLLW
jgi:hypothetical protein